MRALAPPLLAHVALALGAVSIVSYLYFDPFDPDPSKAMARYVMTVPANVGMVILAVLAFRHARDVAPAVRTPYVVLSAALAAFAFGGWVWSYYNFTGVDVPYPSYADIGYLGFPVLAAIGSGMLLRRARRRLQGVDFAIGLAFPLAIFFVFYAVLIQPRFDARTDLVRTTVDLAYPTLDSVYLAFAGLLLFFSRSSPLTPAFRRISSALLLMAFTDGFCLFLIDRGLYFSAGLPDVLYLLAIFLFGRALLLVPGPTRSVEPSARSTRTPAE